MTPETNNIPEGEAAEPSIATLRIEGATLSIEGLGDPVAELPVAGPPESGAFRENVAALIATAVLALFFTTFLAQAFEIPSESMEDTLLVGDRPFVNKVAFAPATSWLKPLMPYEEIHRGDIIIFNHPAEPGRIHMVKRAIGLPGDRIKIVARQVFVNGRMLDEGYKVHKQGTIEDYRDNFPGPPYGQVYREWRAEMPKHVNSNGELVVPAGCYFAMGDNRDYSLDSRYWGFVPRENILGRPLLLFWSIDLTREDYMATSLSDHLTNFVNIITHLPRKTRWNRLFRTFPRVSP